MRDPAVVRVAAYEVMAVLAEHQLRLGLNVITDTVSSLEVARQMWRRAATRAAATLRVIEVVCSDEAAHRSRLEGRLRNIDGFPEPSWDDVLRRREEWEPWAEDRLVVDSINGLDQNIRKAFEFLATAERADQPAVGCA